LREDWLALIVRADSWIRNQRWRGKTVNDNFTAKVRDVIAGHFGIDADRLTDEARLRDDLGADWLDRLELMIAIEDQVAGVEIDDVMVDQIDTVGDLMRVVEGVLDARTGAMMGGAAPR
jgi:acyl carrier protein